MQYSRCLPSNSVRAPLRKSKRSKSVTYQPAQQAQQYQQYAQPQQQLQQQIQQQQPQQFQYQPQQFQTSYATQQPQFQTSYTAAPQPQQYQAAYASQLAQPTQQQAFPQTLQQLQLQLAQAQAPTAQPTMPSYTDAANFQYQQQQDAYNQYQKQLLRQLYSNPYTGQAQTYGLRQSPQQPPQVDYNSYVEQQQQQQLAVQQQQQLQRQLGRSRSTPSNGHANGLQDVSSSYATTMMPTSPPSAYTTVATPTDVTEKLLGFQYSPSDKVSHVKFSSGNLSYNF